jgi:flagellar capping protein FliD
MATTVERIGIVETKVENLSEKLDDLKVDVKEMHDCLDKTRNDLKSQLEVMYNASCEQHAELAKKIGNLEQIRQKMIWMVAGGVAFAGILSGHFEKIIAFIT